MRDDILMQNYCIWWIIDNISIKWTEEFLTLNIAIWHAYCMIPITMSKHCCLKTLILAQDKNAIKTNNIVDYMSRLVCRYMIIYKVTKGRKCACYILYDLHVHKIKCIHPNKWTRWDFKVGRTLILNTSYISLR